MQFLFSKADQNILIKTDSHACRVWDKVKIKPMEEEGQKDQEYLT